MIKLSSLATALALGLATTAGAAPQDATTAVRVGGTINARAVNGVPAPNGISGVLVFDSSTGATLTTTGSSPRTYIGTAFNLGSTGTTTQITQITLFLGSTAAVNYDDVQVSLQLYDVWNGAASPVFSSPAGSVITADLGPLNAAASTVYTVNIPLGTPVTLNGINNHGIAVNYKGATGGGALADTANLTSTLRYGTPFALGSNPAAGYGYRNVDGRTDFNFGSGDLRSFGQTNEGMDLQLYGISTPVMLQNYSVE